jgi:superfamily II DNA/RNA helicase
MCLGVVVVDPLPVVRAGLSLLIQDRPGMEVLAEAGTGTGKTLAYLVPAVLALALATHCAAAPPSGRVLLVVIDGLMATGLARTLVDLSQHGLEFTPHRFRKKVVFVAVESLRAENGIPFAVAVPEINERHP